MKVLCYVEAKCGHWLRRRVEWKRIRLFQKIEEEEEELKREMKDWGEEMDISSVIRNVEWRAMRWCGHIERTAEKSSPKNVFNCSLLWGRDYCGGGGGGSERKFITEGRRLRGGNGWTDYSENRRRLANEGIKRRKVTRNRVISLIFGLGFAYVTEICHVSPDINHIVFSSNISESFISLF